MKVDLVTGDPGAVADLGRSLGGLGAEVTFHARRTDPLQADEVHLPGGVVIRYADAGPAAPHSTDRLLPVLPAFARLLSRRWMADPPAVVHARGWVWGVAALEAARGLGIPIVYASLGTGTDRRRVTVERQLAAESHQLVASTAAEAAALVALGAEPERVGVIPPGVDVDRFAPAGAIDPRPAHLRRLLVVARQLSERSGVDELVAALALLPGVELVVAGGPPAITLDHDAGARRITALAASLGVEDRLRLRGWIPQERMPELLRSADVVACCGVTDIFGVVALEAMACGVPVVCPSGGAAAEHVPDGAAGVHLLSRSPEAMAAAVQRLLDDEGRRRAMGAAAVHLAQRFSWDTVAGELLAVCQRAAQPASAQGLLRLVPGGQALDGLKAELA
jgi:glycosyltransferase involved in cell wall biosynthesis